MYKRIFIALAFILASTTAHSQTGYVGLSVGQSELDLDSFDKGVSFSISAGYRFHENIAVELSYISFGEADDDEEPVWTIELSGVNLAVVGMYPLSEKAYVFGKIGALSWEGTLDEAGTGEIDDDDGSDVSYGVGFGLNLASQFDVVFEFQKFEMDDIDIKADNISLGARYQF